MNDDSSALVVGYRRGVVGTERDRTRLLVATVGAFCGSVPEAVARQEDTGRIMVFFATGTVVEFEPSDLRSGPHLAKRVTGARKFTPPHLSRQELDEFSAALVALAGMRPAGV